MAGPREFGSIGQNRLRTGSVGRFGQRATTATSRGRAKSLGNSRESGEPPRNRTENPQIKSWNRPSKTLDFLRISKLEWHSAASCGTSTGPPPDLDPWMETTPPTRLFGEFHGVRRRSLLRWFGCLLRQLCLVTLTVKRLDNI